MNEIIEVSQERIGTVTVQTVSAKELHAFLGVGRDFSNWIKGRILKYGFIENRDYIVFAKPGENPLGGRPEIEYHISVDMAKQLTMVEDNDKGTQARHYFIECENRLRDIIKPSKELQDKSKEARKGIAAVWSERGASAPKHFINLTFAEYKALGYEKPRSVSKKDMSPDELARLMALEVFESIKLQRLPDVVGYHALKDSISATGAILEAALDQAVLEHERKIGA